MRVVHGWKQEVCEALKEERDRLYQQLQTISYLDPYPSHANFILCSVVGRDAGRLKDALAHKYGIMVRHYAKKELSGFIRISAGKPEHTVALLKALKELEGVELPAQAAPKSLLPKQLESEAQPAGSFTGS
jgi:histidinol-phosphate aminotransferase